MLDLFADEIIAEHQPDVAKPIKRELKENERVVLFKEVRHKITLPKYMVEGIDRTDAEHFVEGGQRHFEVFRIFIIERAGIQTEVFGHVEYLVGQTQNQFKTLKTAALEDSFFHRVSDETAALYYLHMDTQLKRLKKDLPSKADIY